MQRSAPPAQAAQQVFNAESSGYDYKTATAAGMGPAASGENQGHWGSVTMASDADKKSATTYNEALAGVTRQAEQYAFGQIDEQGAADLAHKAALYEFAMHHGIPRIASMYGAAISQRDSRISELEGQVKALTAASPRLDGGSGGVSISDAPTQGDSHLEAARKYFQR